MDTSTKSENYDSEGFSGFPKVKSKSYSSQMEQIFLVRRSSLFLFFLLKYLKAVNPGFDIFGNDGHRTMLKIRLTRLATLWCLTGVGGLTGWCGGWRRLKDSGRRCPALGCGHASARTLKSSTSMPTK